MEKVVISQGICSLKRAMYPVRVIWREELMNIQTFVMSLNLCKILTHYLCW